MNELDMILITVNEKLHMQETLLDVQREQIDKLKAENNKLKEEIHFLESLEREKGPKEETTWRT